MSSLLKGMLSKKNPQTLAFDMDHLQNNMWVIYLYIQQLWLSFTDKNSFPKLSVHFSFIKPKFKLQEKGISVIQVWEPLENTVHSPGEHWFKIWTQ